MEPEQRLAMSLQKINTAFQSIVHHESTLGLKLWFYSMSTVRLQPLTAIFTD